MNPETVTVTGGEWFNLELLLKKLERACLPQLKACGCWRPDECSHDLVMDFVLIDRLGKEGRCKISEDEIFVNFDKARSQRAVLNKFLRYRVLDKKRRCRVVECRFKGTCPLAEEWQDDETGRRIAPPNLATPSNPEDLLRVKEFFDAICRELDPKHLEAFLEHAFDDASHAEIAEALGVSEACARKWRSRDRKKLENKLASILQPDHDDDGRDDGRSPQQSESPRDGRSD